MCQIPIKMSKQHAIPDWSLQNVKIYLSKEWRETSQRWIMFVANTTILELFSWRYYFRLWVFASTDENFYCWHWIALPKLLQGKWCQDLQKPCSIILHFVLTNHMYVYCRLGHLAEVSKNNVDLVLYIIGSD